MSKTILEGKLVDNKVIVPPSDESREINNKSVFGTFLKRGGLQLNLLEALYLVEKGKIIVKDGKNQEFSEDRFIKRAQRHEKNFLIRYAVFQDFRDRGYIIKTALKFGADFRVYDRGVKPGEDHAKWVVYPVPEGNTLTWHEFAAKNRVAHSTKKKLMIAIVDDELDVTYYQVSWMRP